MNYELSFAYTNTTKETLTECTISSIYDKYFEIEYKCGKGHFKIALYSLICTFSLTDYKKVISMLIDDFSGQEKANNLHDIYVSMIDYLNTSKIKHSYDKKILSEISAAFNRLNKLNEILMIYFSIDPLNLEEQIKMQKAIAYKMIGNNLVVDYKAKSFSKYGRTWIVSADSKVRGLKHIIVPCCGLPCASYNGNYKEAIEIVDKELNCRVERALKEKTFPEYIELLKQNGIEKIPA